MSYQEDAQGALADIKANGVTVPMFRFIRTFDPVQGGVTVTSCYKTDASILVLSLNSIIGGGDTSKNGASVNPEKSKVLMGAYGLGFPPQPNYFLQIENLFYNIVSFTKVGPSGYEIIYTIELAEVSLDTAEQLAFANAGGVLPPTPEPLPPALDFGARFEELEVAISSEVVYREYRDTSLETRISQESIYRADSIGSLSTRLSSEVIARGEAVGSLQTRISSEVVRAVDAEDSLAAEISSTQGTLIILSGEVSGQGSSLATVASNLTTLQSRVSTEEHTRGDADDSIAANISLEVAARSSADSSIIQSISNAETSIETLVSTEVSYRTSADTSLETRIETKGDQNVFVQPNQPNFTAPGVWFQTGLGSDGKGVSIWVNTP